MFAKRNDSIILASRLLWSRSPTEPLVTLPSGGAVKAVRLIDVDPTIGYRAGELRAAMGASRRELRDLTVDAVVAATALTLPLPVVVLTSDPDDLRLLLADHDVRVEAL